MHITQITIYPVKSCKGTNLQKTELTPYGLANDRRWMVVDRSGNFLSQRTVPKLALIEPILSLTSLALNAPGQQLIGVDPQYESDSLAEVRIWKDTCSASDCGNVVAGWLSEFLKLPCRLVSMNKTFVRRVDPEYASNEDQVSFADAFPLLLISSASLRDLNNQLEQPIPMNRFRPNLVVGECDPYSEDGWKRIAIGALNFRVSKPCARCTVPTVDQNTGVKGQEPLRTLSAIRRGHGDKVFFGQNLINEHKSGEISVGAEIRILEAGAGSPV